MRPGHRAAALLASLVLALGSGCSSSAEPETAAGPSTRPAVASAPPAPPGPRVGGCHMLSVSEATDPVDTSAPVPCRRRHTSVTVRVGRLSPVGDGHLLAVDSRTLRTQIASACPTEPGPYVGGDRRARRLSRFEVVWFSPSLEQADAGANWFRCDVVAVRSQDRLVPLPARLKGILGRNGALDRFGTCGTSAPDRRGFARVVCSARHSWRAVEVINLPAGARYLAKNVAARGDAACKVVAAKRAHGQLKRTWSFEWPTRAQWASGQRYGYCWVPET